MVHTDGNRISRPGSAGRANPVWLGIVGIFAVVALVIALRSCGGSGPPSQAQPLKYRCDKCGYEIDVLPMEMIRADPKIKQKGMRCPACDAGSLRPVFAEKKGVSQ